MAKRKSKTDSKFNIFLNLLLVLSAVLILAFIVMGMVVIYLGWIYFEWAGARAMRENKSTGIQLNNDQLSELRVVRRNFLLLSDEINKLREEAEYLPRRSDGEIDRRSRQGKAVDDHLSLLKNKLSIVTQQVVALESIPRQRLEKLVSFRSYQLTFRYGALCFPFLLILSAAFPTQGVQVISSVVEHFTGSKLLGVPGFYGILFNGVFSTLILMFLLKIWFRSSLTNKYGKNARLETGE